MTATPSSSMSNLLSRFPSVLHAFCYGSAAFRQKANKRPEMMDFVFAVNNPAKWHKENISLNPNDYSGISLLGANAVSYLQTDVGACVYYNTLIPFEGGKIKYGVVSVDDLVEDLIDWRHLYLSGRLHKPVKVLTSHPDVQNACKQNLENAVRVALLLSPPSFTEAQLYESITSLSYLGDFRMIVGENKNKVQNIVEGHPEDFRVLYEDVLKKFPNLARVGPTLSVFETRYNQDVDPLLSQNQIHHLPSALKNRLSSKMISEGKKKFQPRGVVMDRDKLQVHLREGISSIVKQSSNTQALKGIVSAGLLKTVSYSSAKLQKMFHGMLK